MLDSMYGRVQTPRLYCMEDLSDLTEAVDHIHATLPSSTIIAVGTSMGRSAHSISHYIINYNNNNIIIELKVCVVYNR